MEKFIKKLMLSLLSLLVIVSIVIMYFGYKDYEDLMRENNLDSKIQQIYNRDDFVSYDQISPMLKNAVVATEDSRLYHRKSPLDYRAISRAIWINLKNFKMLEGGSTIPQQVAKNLYFDHSASLRRKVSEYLIARDLLNEYHVNEVLTIYLNIIYYGDGYTGIYAASDGYFNKSALDLSDFEATLLAGIPQAPSVYQLSTNYEGAHKRQKHVLARLVDEKYISQEEADEIFNQGGTYEKEND